MLTPQRCSRRWAVGGGTARTCPASELGEVVAMALTRLGASLDQCQERRRSWIQRTRRLDTYPKLPIFIGPLGFESAQKKPVELACNLPDSDHGRACVADQH